MASEHSLEAEGAQGDGIQTDIKLKPGSSVPAVTRDRISRVLPAMFAAVDTQHVHEDTEGENDGICGVDFRRRAQLWRLIQFLRQTDASSDVPFTLVNVLFLASPSRSHRRLYAQILADRATGLVT